MSNVPATSSTPLSQSPALWTGSGSNPRVTPLAQQHQQYNHLSSQNRLHLPNPQLHHSTLVYHAPSYPFPPFHSDSGLPPHQPQHYSYNSLLPTRYDLAGRPVQQAEGNVQTSDIRTQSVPYLAQGVPPQYPLRQSDFPFPAHTVTASFDRTHLPSPATYQIASKSHDGFLIPSDNSGPQPLRSLSESEVRQYEPSYVAQPWHSGSQIFNSSVVQRPYSEYALHQPRTHPRQNSHPYALNAPYPSPYSSQQFLHQNDMRSHGSGPVYGGPVQVVLQDYSSETARNPTGTGSQGMLNSRKNQSVGDFRLRTTGEQEYEQTQTDQRKKSMPITPDYRNQHRESNVYTTAGHLNRPWPGTQNRAPMAYRMVVRQHPKQTRVVNPNDKVMDRKPIDPPPIVQLEFTDQNRDEEIFLQNPYLFCYASIVLCSREEKDIPGCDVPIDRRPEQLSEDLLGSLVSSLHKLKNTDNQDGGYFIFPDMYVGVEGIFRLCLSLFEIKGMNVTQLSTIFTNTFVSYSNQSFPGVGPSTFLSRSFSDQGVRIKIRKEHRVQINRQSKIKRDIANMSKSVNELETSSSHSNSTCGSSPNTPRGETDGESGRSKRSRTCLDALSFRGSHTSSNDSTSSSKSNDSVDTIASGSPLRTFLSNFPSSSVTETVDSLGNNSPLRSSFVREEYQRLSLEQDDRPRASSSYSQDRRGIQLNPSTRYLPQGYPESHQNQHQLHQHSTGSLDQHPMPFSAGAAPFWPRPSSRDGTPGQAYTNPDSVLLPPLRPKPGTSLPHRRNHEG